MRINQEQILSTMWTVSIASLVGSVLIFLWAAFEFGWLKAIGEVLAGMWR